MIGAARIKAAATNTALKRMKNKRDIRERDKPRLSLNNNTAGVREREDANRTRVAGHLDEIQGVMAITLKLFRKGAVGFIDLLDGIPNLRLRFAQR